MATIESEAGRAVFVHCVTDESGMTIDQASCFVDNIDLASFLQMSAEPPPEQMTQVLEASSVCDIDPSLLIG